MYKLRCTHFTVLEWQCVFNNVVKDMFCTGVLADPQTTKYLLWNEGHMCLTYGHVCKRLHNFKSSGHAKHTTHMSSVLTLLQIQNVQIRKLARNLQ